MKIVRTDAELECPHVDAVLRERGHDLVLLPDGISEDTLAAETRDADLILMCYTPITARVIEGAQRLKAIVKYGVGIDAIDIPAAIDEFIVYIGGEVRVCDYHPSGSDELAGAVAANLADRSATLMANHGLVCIGRSPDDALHAAKVVEHNAHIFWGARLLGGAVALPGKPVRDFTGVYQYVRGETWRQG